MTSPKFTCTLCGSTRPTTERHDDADYGDVCDACHDLVTWTDCLSVDPQAYEKGYIVRPWTRDEKIVYAALGGEYYE
jgi:hypothetical protein